MDKKNTGKLLNLLKKKIIGVFFIITLLLFFNGCWDRREVESLGLVQVLGLDEGPRGKGVTITVMIAIPPKIAGGNQPGGGGNSGNETGTFIISMDSPTIYEGFNLINTTINRDITLIQNSTIILSKDLAKKGICKLIDNLVRFREMRRTTLIFICNGKASDIMNIKPKLEKNPSEYFIDLAMESRRTGMFPLTRLHDFLSAYEVCAQEIYAPYLVEYQSKEPNTEKPVQNSDKIAGKSTENFSSTKGAKSKSQTENVRIEGTAIFKQDKLVGTFDLYESQVLMLLTNQFREAILSVPDPRKNNSKVIIRLIGNIPPQIKYHNRKSENYFTVNLKLEADLISIQSDINYTQPKLEQVLSNQIARILKERIEKVITKAQQEFNSDVFGFGTTVRETFLTEKNWVQYDWPNKFKDAKFKIIVKVAIRRVGVQFHPPVLR